MLFTPHVQGKPQAATYATVKDAIVQHIQKTFKDGQDVAESIEKGVLFDLRSMQPVRGISTETDPTRAALEQTGLDIKYQEEFRRFLDRQDNLRQGMVKAYALIFSNYCNKTIQSRVEEHPDFESEIKNNPIKLLEAIKSLMHDPIRAQYPMVSMTEALTRLVNVKQADNEPLLDYVKRFKQLRDVTKSHIGTKLLYEFCEHQVDYKDLTTDEGKKAFKEEAFEAWMAYLLIRGSDQSKYGSLVKNLVSQYSLGNDQYPKTITTATDVLSNHRLDARFFENQKHRREQQQQTRGEGEATGATSFAQKEKDVVCFICGKPGHRSPQCPDKDSIPKAKWAINRAMAGMQSGGSDAADDVSEVSADESVQTAMSSRSTRGRKGWSGYQLQTLSKAKNVHKQCTGNHSSLKDVILLDSGSSIGATFMNPDLVTNVKVAKDPIMMTTNAGTKVIGLEGQVTGFGKVHYDPTMMANIFGLSEMVDRYRVTFDSQVEDAFIVHLKDAKIKFARTPEGLYAYKPTKQYLVEVAESKGMSPPIKDDKGAEDHKSFLVATLSENRKGYTQRQFEDAKRARKLYHIVGCPTLENFKHILRQNIIKNCPVTPADVDLAEKIFGPDIGKLKGKTTRKAPPRVKEDLVEVPPELKEKHQDLTFCMDILYINGMPMLTGIDRSIRFRSLVPLDNRTADELYEGLDLIFRHYNNAGYNITTILCDQEFKPIMDLVNDELGVAMNYTTTDEHVPEAERNNRTIAERIRCAYHNLPYKAMPKVMLRYLAMVSTKQLNLLPAKGGVSAYLSPHVILGGSNLDFNKHCQIPFGAYVQAYQENSPKNTNQPRTLDAIYLRPTNNIQGGHELMDLNSGRVITRQRVWEIPVTPIIIQAVEAMAEEQGIKTLKLQNRRKTIFYPADWIAGVDYEDEDNNNEDKDTNNEDDDDNNDDNNDDDEANFDRVDQDELDELLEEDSNPTDRAEPPIEAEAEHPDEAQPDDAHDEPEEEPDEDPPEAEQEPERVQPPRTRRPPERLTYNQTKHVEFDTTVDPENVEEYNPQYAMLIARIMSDINAKTTMHGASYGQQYILQKGLKKFKEAGEKAASKELEQLHKRNCFTPIDVNKLSPMEKRKTMEALMFLTEKRDKSIKGRMVYNGKPTREWLSREDAASPTVALESIMLTAIIDAKEKRDVMTADVPNAFIQAQMPNLDDANERVFMKITGVLVDLLVEMAPEVYKPFVTFEGNKKVVYVQVLRALYGMLVAALLWYKKFRCDLEQQEFVFNPYDPCVANKMINSKQHTVRFHVDDLMSSHVDSKVNDKFEVWLNKMYGAHGKVKTTRGKIHDYLGMVFDFYHRW
jgi:hypothetical protein